MEEAIIFGLAPGKIGQTYVVPMKLKQVHPSSEASTALHNSLLHPFAANGLSCRTENAPLGRREYFKRNIFGQLGAKLSIHQLRVAL